MSALGEPSFESMGPLRKVGALQGPRNKTHTIGFIYTVLFKFKLKSKNIKPVFNWLSQK